MADVRKLLMDAIRKKGLDMAKVSKAIGKNHAYVQQFVTLGKPKRLPEDVRHDLAKEVGISEDLLREPRPGNQSSTSVSETRPQEDSTEEQIMELVRFLKKLRDGQEDRFDEAVARLFRESPARPQLVERTS